MHNYQAKKRKFFLTASFPQWNKMKSHQLRARKGQLSLSELPGCKLSEHPVFPLMAFVTKVLCNYWCDCLSCGNLLNNSVNVPSPGVCHSPQNPQHLACVCLLDQIQSPTDFLVNSSQNDYLLDQGWQTVACRPNLAYCLYCKQSFIRT